MMKANKYILLSLLIFLPFSISQTVTEILNSWNELNEEVASHKYPTKYDDFEQNNIIDAGSYGTYDFIIVGGGSAGTVLAARLSEVPSWNILLLEAGQNDTIYTEVTGFAPYIQLSKYNWGFKTIPQKNSCLGMNNRQCSVNRGKGLGGSSTTNYVMYLRGNKLDYDNWAAAGNSGWSYEDVLPYFKKIENVSLSRFCDIDYHGTRGNMHVEHNTAFAFVGQNYIDGCEELGRKTLDYNGETQIGVSIMQSNTINGKRVSGNSAYLSPVSDRNNLKIVTGAFVTKIYFKNEDGLKAWKVEFLLGNKRMYAENIKEIILSAGAINTPQILLQSGVGPKEHLKMFDIDVIADLPVGQNLHDHVAFINLIKTNLTIAPTELGVKFWIKSFLNNGGLFGGAVDIQFLSFFNAVNEKATFPDILEYGSLFFNLQDDVIHRIYNYKNDTFDIYFDLCKPYCTALFHVLLYPNSRGSIKLKSKDIFDHPAIDLNYFSDPDDLEPLVRSFQKYLDLLNTANMRSINSHYVYKPLPECPQELPSDDYIKCAIRHMSISTSDLAGTCKMGPQSDLSTVVNHELKVHGISNLRVIDASVIPFPLSGHTSAPTFMIAEKGSDIIKAAWSTFSIPEMK